MAYVISGGFYEEINMKESWVETDLLPVCTSNRFLILLCNNILLQLGPPTWVLVF